jgi:hypothetical protein
MSGGGRCWRCKVSVLVQHQTVAASSVTPSGFSQVRRLDGAREKAEQRKHQHLAATDPKRYERAALRWLHRFIDERLPPLTEVALAASALAELRHGNRNIGIEILKRLLRHG